MGTSQSSKGAPGGVPMVPSWVPPVPAGDGLGAGDADNAADGAADAPSDAGAMGDGASTSTPGAIAPVATPALSTPMAPAGRFSAARRGLGSFARSGDSNSMRRGVGNFVRQGYGGSATATRRLGGTARNAGALYSMLAPGAGSGAGGETISGAALDRAVLAGRSAREVMDAVIEAVRPVDGTLDAEASRRAMNEALSEVLDRFQDANLLDLTEEQRELAVESYVASDVFRLFEVDLGAHIQKNAPTAAAAVARLRDVRNYIRQTVAASFRNLRAAGRTLTSSRVASVVRAALRESFAVFEGYAE